MDVSHVTAAQVQGAQGQHHHHLSIGERISKVESAIDDAVTSGILGGDQAVQMKKALSDITKLVNHNSHKQNGSNNDIASATPLSANDREKIRSDLQELEKQFLVALNPQDATGVPTAAAHHAKVDDLFKAMDTNGDGKISRDEFNKTAAVYGQQGSVTVRVSIRQSQFNITA